MLERVSGLRAHPPGAARSVAGGDSNISYDELFAFVRRYLLSTTACIAAGVVAAGLSVASIEPTFTARTQLLIDSSRPALPTSDGSTIQVSLDTAEVESQIAVLRSELIGMMVIRDLDLVTDPELQGRKISRLRQLCGFATAHAVRAGWLNAGTDWEDTCGIPDPSMLPAFATALSPTDRERLALNIFESNLGVSRVGISYVIEISFQSPDPEKAARIANATADAYIREQLQSRVNVAQDGNRWLEVRLEEIRKQLNTATQAAQRFRATHDYRVAVDDSTLAEAPASGGANKDLVSDRPTLEQLEAAAETYRKYYESLLTAYTSSVQHQSYPYSLIRVITPASTPWYKSHPRTKLMLAFGGLLGLVSGVGSALLRYNLDRRVRSGRQIRHELGVECLAEIPWIGNSGARGHRLTEVAMAPSTAFSESIRRLRIGICAGVEQFRCIGVISPAPGDGKSTIVANLAIASSVAGRRALVIDADIEKATLTSKLARGAEVGFAELLESDADAADALVTVGPGWFDLLPMTSSRRGTDLAATIGSAAAHDMLAQLSGTYEAIFIDLPPFASAVDVLSASPHLDGLVVLAEWGKTPIDEISEMLDALRLVRANVLGVAMNKVRSKSKRAYKVSWRQLEWVPLLTRARRRGRQLGGITTINKAD